MITLDDFKKLDIRIATVVSVEKLPNADKLLKFIFDLGSEKRQILAGMAEFYPDPSVLVGKQIPILTNIEPRTLRGEVSHGMIVAADTEGKPVLLHPEHAVASGTMVK